MNIEKTKFVPNYLPMYLIVMIPKVCISRS